MTTEQARRPLERAERHALLSPDGIYRYTLQRTWAPDGELVNPLAIIMLNPSTADAETDDPTIRRCAGIADRLGYTGIHVTNLYALRATSPVQLVTHPDPIGPDNDSALTAVATLAANLDVPVLCAWGTFQLPHGRHERTLEILQDANTTTVALGTTKNGSPRHPLYIPNNTQLKPWPRAH